MRLRSKLCGIGAAVGFFFPLWLMIDSPVGQVLMAAPMAIAGAMVCVFVADVVEERWR